MNHHHLRLTACMPLFLVSPHLMRDCTFQLIKTSDRVTAIVASDEGSVSESGGRSPVAWFLQTRKSWPWGCRSASRARGRAKSCALVSSDSLLISCPTADRTNGAIGQSRSLFSRLLLPHAFPSVHERSRARHVFLYAKRQLPRGGLMWPHHSSRQKGKYTGKENILCLPYVAVG
jgi:hypothetical protein